MNTGSGRVDHLGLADQQVVKIIVGKRHAQLIHHFETAGGAMTGLLRDLRHGVRSILRNPGFGAIAIFTFALGIGANSAIFSVVNAVLLSPLPFKEPNRLMAIWERNTAIGKDRDPVAP